MIFTNCFIYTSLHCRNLLKYKLKFNNHQLKFQLNILIHRHQSRQPVTQRLNQEQDADKDPKNRKTTIKFSKKLIIKKMQSKQLFLLSICLLIISTRNQCSIPKADQTKIKSGQFTLQADQYINKSSTLAYQLLYKEPFATDPAIAFGINGFDVGGEHVSGLDIKVGKNSCTKAKFQISFKSSSNWNSIQVNFMATNRLDMQIGTVGYSGFVVDKTVQLKYAFQKKWSKQVTLKYKIFLSSFKIRTNQQNTLRISLQKSQTTSSSLDMVYFVPSSLTEIQEISVSVILFDSMNPSFRYSEGVVSQTYIQSIYSIQVNKQDVSELKTYMIGLTSFDVSVASASTSSINLYSNINDNFILHVGTDNERNGKGSQCQVKYVMVSYLVLSVYPQCGACLGNYVKFEDKCVDKCPLGYFPKLGKCERQNCSKGSYLSPTSNKCQKCPKFSNIKQCQNPCPIGTTLQGQQCNLICPSQNQIYSYNTCICKSGYYRIGTQCKKCVQGTQYDYGKQNCVSICQQNSRYMSQSGKCVCLDNYQMFGGKCIKCETGEVFDVAWGCRVKCGEFMEFDGFSCKCVKGYYKNDGKCIKCGDGLVYNDSKKVCVSRCQSTQVWEGNRCICAKDYYRVKGLCKKCLESEQYDSKNQNCRPKCLKGQVLVKDKCECLSKSYLIGGSCQTCPAQTQYSKDSNRCQNICKKKYQKYTNGKCVCFDGYYRQNGECIPTKCPQNSNYDSTSQTCLCLPPYSFNQKTSKCLLPPTCPQHSSLKNKICTCEQNFYMNKDKTQCIKCDTQKNEIFNGISCQCKEGYVRNIRQVCVKIVLPQCRRNQRYNAQGRICQCVDGFQRLGGDCMKVEKCKENQYFNGMECVCESGYFKKDGSSLCKKVAVEEPKCPYNSKFNGQKCVCNQNFFQISPGICGTCPYDMSWNGRKCAYGKQCWKGYQWDEKTQCCKPIGDHQCPENSRWNGNACECKEEYYSIDGQCKKCEQNQKYNGTDCQKSQDSKQKECIGTNRIFINGSCVCKPNTHEYNGKCIQCDYPTIWNGQYCQGNTNSCFTVPNSIMDPTTKRCKCKDGFRGVNGKCVAIPGYLYQNGTVYRWADGYRWAGPNVDYQKLNTLKNNQADHKKKQKDGNSNIRNKDYQDYYTSNGIQIRISSKIVPSESDNQNNKQNKNYRDHIDYTSNIQHGPKENDNNHIENVDQNIPEYNGNIINGPNNQVDGYGNIVNGEGNVVKGEGNIIYGGNELVENPSQQSNTNTISRPISTNTIIYPNTGNIDTAPGTNQINGQGNIVDGKGNSINGQGNTVRGDGNIIMGNDGTIPDFFMPNIPINLPQYLASIPTNHKNQQLGTSPNKIDGNGNTVYGTNNKVAGDDNEINGNNIFVFGSGNQVY